MNFGWLAEGVLSPSVDERFDLKTLVMLIVRLNRDPQPVRRYSFRKHFARLTLAGRRGVGLAHHACPLFCLGLEQDMTVVPISR